MIRSHVYNHYFIASDISGCEILFYADKITVLIIFDIWIWMWISSDFILFPIHIYMYCHIFFSFKFSLYVSHIWKVDTRTHLHKENRLWPCILQKTVPIWLKSTSFSKYMWILITCLKLKSVLLAMDTRM